MDIAREAAHIMVQYLRQPSLNIDYDPSCSIFSTEPRRSCTILELGSGNGFVGINLARQLHGSRQVGDLIVLTDLPDVCSLLEENVALELRELGTSHEVGQKTPDIRVQPLSWGVSGYATKLLSFLQDRSRDSTCDAFEVSSTFTHIICSDLVSIHVLEV